VADDDIKKDADNQRKKPGPSKEEASSEEQSNILKDIKESLIGASSGLGEGANSAHLEEISKNVLRIADLQQIQYENNLESLKIEKDRLEGSSVKALDEGEERREQLDIFKEIRDSLKQSKGGVEATGADGDSGGGLGAGALVGLGFAAKKIGAGAMGIGAGIAIVLASFLAADKIATEFNIEGEGLKKVMLNLGEALEGFGAKGLTAMAVILAAGVFGGGRGGIGVGAIGAGLAAFFLALGATEKGLSWMGSDYTGLTPIFKNFSNAMDALSSTALATLGVLLGASAVFGPK